MYDAALTTVGRLWNMQNAKLACILSSKPNLQGSKLYLVSCMVYPSSSLLCLDPSRKPQRSIVPYLNCICSSAMRLTRLFACTLHAALAHGHWRCN